MKTEVIAHLVTGEDIKDAVITTNENMEGIDFEGSDRDQKATVFTDDNGRLVWGISVDTTFAHAMWKVTLTKKGEKENTMPDDHGLTDQMGHATGGGFREF